MKVIDINAEKIGDADAIITIKYQYKLFWLFGEKRITTKQYRGWSSIWRHYPSGLRCSTGEELELCDYWTKLIKWPEADLSKTGVKK